MDVLSEAEQVLVTRQEEVEVAFTAFQATIAQLLGPLDWLPLNMNDFVFLMPLLIASSLGGGMAWVLQRRMRYVQMLDTAQRKSEAVRDVLFSLRLDSSTGRVRLLAMLSIVVGIVWVVYSNLLLIEFVALQEGTFLVVPGGIVSYSVVLNWGVSFALLIGGFIVSWQALRSHDQESAD